MVPGRERRRTKLERGMMRLVATGGIIGIAVVLGAVLVGQDAAGWIVGLVVGLTSVILAALLWSSRAALNCQSAIHHSSRRATRTHERRSSEHVR